MKCFCGKEAVCILKIIEENPKHTYRFLQHPRCEDCMNRALNSYKDVKVEPLQTENDS